MLVPARRASIMLANSLSPTTRSRVLLADEPTEPTSTRPTAGRSSFFEQLHRDSSVRARRRHAWQKSQPPGKRLIRLRDRAVIRGLKDRRNAKNSSKAAPC
jgi:hypothetical protein